MTCRDATYRQRGPSQRGTFKAGSIGRNRVPVGTERVRQRKHRTDAPRVWVKIADPNVWEPRAVVVWRDAGRTVPTGSVIHHVNDNSLDDRLENLTVLTRSEHAKHHKLAMIEARHHAAPSKNES